jgi:antitoxin HigA-1
MKKRNLNSHAGSILHNEYLLPLGMSVHTLAQVIDLQVDDVMDIIEGRRPMDFETAKRLSAQFSTSVGFWMNLPNVRNRIAAQVPSKRD